MNPLLTIVFGVLVLIWVAGAAFSGGMVYGAIIGSEREKPTFRRMLTFFLYGLAWPVTFPAAFLIDEQDEH